MKKILFLFILLFTSILIFSKDFSLFNNISNPMQFNPAATGIFYKNRLAISTQMQGLTSSESPKTYQFNYEKLLKSTKSGIGIIGRNDYYFFNQEQFLQLQYSYKLITKNSTNFYVGAGLNFNSHHFKPSWINLNDFNEFDPVIPVESHYYGVQVSLGLLLKSGRYNLAFSGYPYSGTFNSNPTRYKQFYNVHFFADAKVIDSKKLDIVPQFSYIFCELGNMLEGGLNFIFSEKINFGIQINNNKSVTPSIGYRYNQFQVNLASSINLKQTGNFTNTGALLIAWTFQ